MQKRKARKTATVRPISMISPVPAVVTEPVSRPFSHKRISRLRINWFVVGSVFGVGISFFMNFLVTALVIPQYEAMMGRSRGDIAFNDSSKPAAPAAPAAPQVAVAEPTAPDHSFKLADIAGIFMTDARPTAAAPAPAAPEQPHTGWFSLSHLFHHDTTAPAEATPADDEQDDVADADATTSKAAPAAAPAKPTINYPQNLTLRIGNGETLLSMLLRHNVPAADAHNVIAALKGKLNPGSLKAGQQITLTLARHETLQNAAAVQELAIKLPNFSTVELSSTPSGAFSVSAIKAELKDRAFHPVGIVKTSLYQGGASAGIPLSTMREIVTAFSYDVDFQRDIHPGDKIEALLDRKQTDDGQVGGYDNLRYAALTLHGRKMEIFRFKDGNGDYAWYDAKGNSVKKSLLRTPIDAATITSGFGMRMHPILGYTKFHKGVDFGAAQGTPIMAAGDGIIEQRGWVNGYGNFILIKHNDKYETAYGHMSRFGAIPEGGHVKQGQVIGYVGMTGQATGPHLHYEVRENGTQVNPTQKQFNLATGLTGKQLASFNANKQGMIREMASLSKPAAAPAPKVASAR